MGDPSIDTTTAAIYFVIYQPAQISKSLVTAKAQLPKKYLTIPSRLILVAMHIAANLCQNRKSVSEGKYIQNISGSIGRAVALHWVRAKKNYKQFVKTKWKRLKIGATLNGVIFQQKEIQ